MNPFSLVVTRIGLPVLVCGLGVFVAGCDGEQGSAETVARAQEETSAAWAKEKADHPKSTRTTGKSTNVAPTGQRGTINRAGQ
jgi:hypothetical protein